MRLLHTLGVIKSSEKINAYQIRASCGQRGEGKQGTNQKGCPSVSVVPLTTSLLRLDIFSLSKTGRSHEMLLHEALVEHVRHVLHSFDALCNLYCHHSLA